MARRLTLFAILLLLLVGFLRSRTRQAGSERGEPLTQETSPAPGVVVLLPARALPPGPVAAESASASTRQEAPPRSTTMLTGRVVPGPGVVLLPDESIDGHEVAWLPPPKLTPRFDTHGNALAPFETFGGVGGEVVIGADGRFEFAPVVSGEELTLRVRGSLGKSEMSCAPLQSGERREVELPLEHERIELPQGIFPLRWVSGRVLDEQGQAVAGIEVHLSLAPSWGAYEEQVVTTDELGGFLFETVPPDRARVWVVAGPGVAIGCSVALDARASDLREIALGVERGVVFEGRVLWPDGAEVEHFLAELGDAEAYGKDGAFRFEAASGEEEELLLVAQTGRRLGTWRGRVRPGETRDFVLQEHSPCTLSLAVVDPEGYPLAANAWLRPLEHPLLASSSRQGDRRSMSLRVPCGEARLSVTALGFLEHDEVLGLDSSRDLRITLSRAPLLRGVVLDAEGNPASDARVQVSGGQEDSPDREGRFELSPQLREGQLFAYSKGGGHSDAVSFSAVPGETIDGLVLRLKAGGTLVGELVEPRWGTVLVECAGVLRETSCDRSGAFRFDALPRGPGEAWVLFENGREGPRVAFELVAGETTRIELPVR